MTKKRHTIDFRRKQLDAYLNLTRINQGFERRKTARRKRLIAALGRRSGPKSTPTWVVAGDAAPPPMSAPPNVPSPSC